MSAKHIYLLACLFFAGCGYTFQGAGSVLPADIKRVAIPLVENNSPEPGLSAVVTESLRDRFERFGVLTVVEDVGDADAVLRARIKGIKRSTHTVTSTDSTELTVNTTLSVSCELRRVTGPVLYRNNNVSITKPFGTTSGVVVTTSSDFASGTLSGNDLGSLSDREVSRSQEKEALVQLSDEIAKKIYDDAVAPDF